MTTELTLTERLQRRVISHMRKVTNSGIRTRRWANTKDRCVPQFDAQS